MKRLGQLLVLVSTLLAGAVVAVEAQQVSASPSTVALARYQGCAWIGALSEIEGDRKLLSAVEQLTASIVQEELRRRGIRKASKDKADLLAGFHGAIDRKLEIAEALGSGSAPLALNEIDEGTLVVDLIDRVGKKRIWRGFIRGELKPNVPWETRKVRLTKALREMFKLLATGK